MTAIVLAILDHVTRAGARKDIRQKELLRDPTTGATPGWFMHVPTCFNDALDIRRTVRVIERKPTLVWTQGATFGFKAGDVLYDTPVANMPWGEALREIQLAVQIRAATDATSPQPGTARTPGIITFDILRPTSDRTKLQITGHHTLTQDQFVRLLIAGEGLPQQRA